MAGGFASRMRRALRPLGNVDGVTSGRVVGWAMGHGKLSVEAWVDGQCVARTTPDGQRRDVAVAFPGHRNALTSGFSLTLPAGAAKVDGLSELQIIARPASTLMPAANLGTFQLAGRNLQQSLATLDSSGLASPFPRAVTDLVASHWSEDCEGLDSVAGQRRFVARLKHLMATPGLNSLQPLADYIRYLTVTLAHCRFVERCFPVENPRANAGASDFHCKPNSVRELFPIIHQLYVLRSNGVQGDFAEFGCFKGYSTSMLSFACSQLGTVMHVFDSFEGLPPSEGASYEAGQFAGSLHEVRANVQRFGAPGNVQFRKGFFADTFRSWRPPSLMCMWMDVDLEVSARDLLVVADKLDQRGTIFSHECVSEIFCNGEITSAPSADNPVAPLLERFEELGRPLTGHYVAGYTGAFWSREQGIPVIDADVLFDLASSLP